METGNSESLSVGREIEGSNNGRLGVNGKVVLIVTLTGVFRSIVFCSFGDPTGDESDLNFVKRVLLFRHLSLALGVGRDFFDEIAFLRLSGDDCDIILAAFKKTGEIGHDVAALVLGRLVAADAVCLKNRADVGVVADWFLRLGSS